MRLSMFDLKLVHVPGSTLIGADTLSRNPTFDNGEGEDELIVMLPDKLFVRTIDTSLQDRLIEASIRDPFISTTRKAMENGLPLPMKSALREWRHENNLLFYQDRCYVPDSTDL